MSITVIEDAIIDAVRGLDLFAMVESLGRHGEPPLLVLPAALVYFAGDGENAESVARPVDQIEYHVQVRTQSQAGETAVARNAYVLIDAVRLAIRGKGLGIPAIEPFRCVGREITDYKEAEGEIEYTLKFTTREYQPVVVE